MEAGYLRIDSRLQEVETRMKEPKSKQKTGTGNRGLGGTTNLNILCCETLICAAVLRSLVWGLRTAVFQLSGFFCRGAGGSVIK